MGALSSRARVPGTLAGMKTHTLISLCGRLLLALMLAAPAGVALSPSPAMAQAAPAAASDKDKAAQGGNANPALASDVAAHLGIPLGKAIVGRFSDGEVNVEILENVRGKDAFVIQSTCAPTNDHLMELLILVDALRRASVGPP